MKMKKFVRKGIAAGLAAMVALSGYASLFPAIVSAESHVDNPFAGATAYVNPDYAAQVDASILKVTDADLKAKMETVKTYPTSVWLDRIAAIQGDATHRSLEQHLDTALAQKKGDTPITASFVIYDLPGRDCHALASNGELPLTQAALERYKTEYIDVIAGIFAKPKYQGIRIVTVIEPDSLPNLVTNLNDPECAQASSSGIYVSGIQYALDKLHAVSNVYTYLDIGHSGWLGWDNNRSGAITLITNTVKATKAGLASVDGFVTNTANSTPLVEPNLPDPNLTINGQPIRSSKYYEWNPYFDETDFTAALYSGFVAAGWPTSLGMLIDTSRNGWGGPDRPTGASGSDINTYVNSGRVDKRDHRGLWCNSKNAGMGTPPESTPSGFPASHLDAFVWVKPPGDSDGASSAIPNDEGKGFDRMCDPTYVTPDGVLSGALPNAPLSGHWFHDQFVMLVQNAFPVIPANNGPVTKPAAPAGLTATAGNGQAVLNWKASSGAASYNVKSAVAPGGPYATIATSVTGNTYTKIGLTNGTTYYFVVSAVNAAGESANSIEASVTPIAGTTAPAVPTGLKVTAGSGQAVLSWAASSGAAGYNVKRATVNGGPYTTVAAGVTGLGFTDTGLTNGTTYYYVVSAVNASGESANSAQAAVTPKDSGIPAGNLTVQYKAGDTNATDSQIKPQFNIKNNGSTAVSLNDLKLRYYFSKDGSQSMSSWVDWAQVGSENIQRTFTDTYVELSFTAAAGAISAGGQSGEIQLRMAKSDWSSFNEANDYSFDPTKTSYANWDKVTLYQGNSLVWGIEP